MYPKTETFALAYTDKRDQLFFGQYKYCMRLSKIDRSFILRDCFTRGSKEMSLDTKHRTVNDRSAYYHRAFKDGKLSDTSLELIFAKKLIDLLHGNKNFHATVDYQRLSFYSNDLALLNSILQVYLDAGYANNSCLITAEALGAPGVKRLKYSKYRYRTYLNENRRDAEVKNIFNWLSNQGDTVKPSPSLQYRMNNAETEIWRHYFFDHDDTKILHFLDLVSVKARRQTLPIQAEYYLTK